MSLLLDALKKAAEQKLEKEGSGDTELETGIELNEKDSAESVAADAPDDAAQDGRTVLDLDATELGSERQQTVDKTDFLKAEDTQLGQEEWSLTDATAFDDMRETRTSDVMPSDYKHLQDQSDTIVDDTGLNFDPHANTDTGGLQREWQALSADASQPSAHRTAHSPEFDAGQDTMERSFSLTESIEREKAAFAGNEQQASYMFANKAPVSSDGKRKWALYGIFVVAGVLVGTLYGYEYIMQLSDDSANYRPIRPSRAMQLEPAIKTQVASAQEIDEAVAETALLIDEEDYAALLDDELGAEHSVNTAQTQTNANHEDTTLTPSKSKIKPSTAASQPTVQKAAFKPTPRSSIRISKQAPTRSLQAVLLEAYEAYQAGDTATAEDLYQQAIARDNNNRDALLGLGALALNQQRFAEAQTYYHRVLLIDPRDTYAIAGMDAVKTGLGAGQSLSESQLKHLISQRPQAHELHFSLGNLYARQLKWSAAQKSYFSAYRLDSQNPDYLFNLAVSLDHLGQSKAAVQFYQQAIATTANRAKHFDVAAANKRLDMLLTSKPE